MAKRKKRTTPPSARQEEPLLQQDPVETEAEEAKEELKEAQEPEETIAPSGAESGEEITENAEPELTEETPYTPYRYRWEVGKEAKRQVNFKALLITCVSVILALGLVCLSVFAALWANRPTEPETPDAPAAGAIVLSSVPPRDQPDALTVGEMIDAVKKSVVGIHVVKEDTTTGVASGLVVHADGYIITNRHVVENAQSITVYVSGESYAGSVIGSDELSDIAVIRIHGESFVAAELGDSSQVKQGDWVVAIGTPGGLEFSASATLGIVSGTDRRVQMEGTDAASSKTYTVIQTDASINPGNSGGPLVNVYGQVVGINSMKLSNDSYESIGFALPINGVISVANQIIENGRVEERPKEDYVVGAAIFGANFEYFSALSAQENSLVAGAYVKTVTVDGPADKAGVRMGDIITTFDGKPVTSLSVITEILAEKKAGDKVTVELYRNRESKTVKVKLAAYQG